MASLVECDASPVGLKSLDDMKPIRGASTERVEEYKRGTIASFEVGEPSSG